MLAFGEAGAAQYTALLSPTRHPLRARALRPRARSAV